MPAEPRSEARAGVDMPTLVVAALASLVAALASAKLWPGATLVSAAMTPVIITLVKEYLQRPAERAVALASAPFASRTAHALQPVGAETGERPLPPDAERDGLLLHDLEAAGAPGEPVDVETTDDEAAPYVLYRRPRRRRAWWRVGLVTGLLGFLVAAAALTLPELVAGDSVAGSGRTTLFSGGAGDDARDGDRAPAGGESDDQAPGSSAEDDGEAAPEEPEPQPTAEPEETATPAPEQEAPVPDAPAEPAAPVAP